MIIIEKAKKLKDLLKEDYLYTLETMLQDGFTVEGAISLMYDFYTTERKTHRSLACGM